MPKPYPLPVNESLRRMALREYGVLGTAPEPDFDRVVQLASDLFGTPTALVSLVDDEHQFFKARVGMAVCETSRDVSFCAHVLEGDDVLVVPDARRDPRFLDNPLVTGPPFIRFYAGAALVTPKGLRMGSLCVIDDKPRLPLLPSQVNQLRILAGLVMDLLERRRLAILRTASLHLADATPDAIVCSDETGRITFWNRSSERIFGYRREEAVGQPLSMIIPEGPLEDEPDDGPDVPEDGHEARPGPVERVGVRKDGSRVALELSVAAWEDDEGSASGTIIRDLTEKRRAVARMRFLTHFDRLTGLPNRVQFIEKVASALAGDRPIFLLKIAIDRFSDVNATLGLSVGDAVLKESAERIAGLCPAGAFIARLGADEFGVICEAGENGASPAILAEAIRSAFTRPLDSGGAPVRVSVSVGAVLCPAGTSPTDAGIVIENAMLALRHAKQAGRDRVELFQPELRERAEARSHLEEELHRAFENREFELFYQPQIRFSDGAVVGAEALLRWRHPERGLLSPAAFIPVLEASVLAAKVGNRAIDTACGFAAGLAAGGHPIRVSVNLFAAQLRTGNLLRTVQESLAAHALPATQLELEITETTVLKLDQDVMEMLAELRRSGVGIAFDDYGTGYASLSLLKHYPLTRLKIEREFVRDLETDPGDAAIVQAVIGLGRGLGLAVTAEGIENERQAEFLHALGCDEAQGYWFGRPMPAGEFRDRVLARTPLAA